MTKESVFLVTSSDGHAHTVTAAFRNRESAQRRVEDIQQAIDDYYKAEYMLVDRKYWLKSKVKGYFPMPHPNYTLEQINEISATAKAKLAEMGVHDYEAHDIEEYEIHE